MEPCYPHSNWKPLMPLESTEIEIYRDIPLLRLCGFFYRVVRQQQIENVLSPLNVNSAGRYHSPGQSILYMSPELEWAQSAISPYMLEDRHRRFVIPLRVENALVFDQRDAKACDALKFDPRESNMPWRAALKTGNRPPSWANSDAVRGVPADGIIDPSRNIPGGWHLNLFKWNTADGPQVIVAGRPKEVFLD